MNAAPNKSLDVRAKQRLCYHVVFLTQPGLAAVSPHVNSVVRRRNIVVAIMKKSNMPSTEKHSIVFDESAKQELNRISGLPDLETVSDEHQITDICMFFGSAAYYAQFFEASLRFSVIVSQTY